MALFNRLLSKDSAPAPPPVTYTPPSEEPAAPAPAAEETPELDFLKPQTPVEETPELDFLKPQAPAEEVPELDFLKAPAPGTTTTAAAASSTAFETTAGEDSPVPGLAYQNQYKRLILETEMPPVITVCRYGPNYVATDHIRNLQAVDNSEYAALEALLKQYKQA